jgi:plastocyanin
LETIQTPVSPISTQVSLPSGKGIITDPAALNQLMFQDTDFSSVIVASKFESVAAEKIDPNSTLLSGFLNGCSFEGTFDKKSGRAYQEVMLIDSKANASKTYDNLDNYVEKQFQSFVKVPLTNVSVSVGDRGKMYVIHNIDQGSLIYYMIFVRGNVFEVVGLEVPVTSTQGDDIIIDLARKADRKITSQPLPIISPAPCPTAVLVPPPTPFNTIVTPVHTPIPTVRTTDITQARPSPTGVVNTIAIKNFAFDPSTLTVKSGTAVMWTNLDAAPHAIVFDIGSPVTYSSGSLPPGSSYLLTFTRPGTYMYHCSIHPSMKGTIIVQT